jgi:cytochrome c peroxidase
MARFLSSTPHLSMYTILLAAIILAGCSGGNSSSDTGFPTAQPASAGKKRLLSDAVLLDRAIARFKTPGLRDLGHSAPYMHNGQFDTLDSIIQFYRGVSAQTRAGTLRNGAAQLQGIAITAADVASVVAFLKTLNEDYE